jgi:FlaA1/EpsC-like NDP-sugar epimerase
VTQEEATTPAWKSASTTDTRVSPRRPATAPLGGTSGGPPPAVRRRLPDVVKPLRRREGSRRSGLLLLADACATSLAFYIAYLVRFDGHIPQERLGQLLRCLPVLLLIRIALSLAFGLHRWSFRLSGLHEGLRIVQATVLGSALFTASFYFAQRAVEDVSIGPPRSVIVIELLLTTALLGAMRFSLRVGEAWGMNAFRPVVGEWVRTIIVGAGSAGELLMRDLQRSDEHNYKVLGFVDDLPSKRGAMIAGRMVLGSLDELPEVCRRWRIEQVLFAIPRLAPERLRQVLDSCADLALVQDRPRLVRLPERSHPHLTAAGPRRRGPPAAEPRPLRRRSRDPAHRG